MSKWVKRIWGIKKKERIKKDRNAGYVFSSFYLLMLMVAVVVLSEVPQGLLAGTKLVLTGMAGMAYSLRVIRVVMSLLGRRMGKGMKE
jgi:hypothetical protein